MVYTLKKWMNEHWQPEKGGWIYAAQLFVGLFFLGAALLKFNTYFVSLKGDLGVHLQYWIDSGWTPNWYAWLIETIAKPHAKVVAGFVIAIQGLGGLLLAVKSYTRTAAFFLFALQLNIFIGTFLSLDFVEFVGLSLWLMVFYFCMPTQLEHYNQKIWKTLIVILCALCLMQSYNTFQAGDHNLASFWGKVSYLQQDAMSAHPLIKQYTLAAMHTTYAPYLWVFLWYTRIVLALLLLTKWRLQAGCALLLFWVGTSAIWTNAGASQNTLWLLTLFVFVTMEQYLQFKKHRMRPNRVKIRQFLTTLS